MIPRAALLPGISRNSGQSLQGSDRDSVNDLPLRSRWPATRWSSRGHCSPNRSDFDVPLGLAGPYPAQVRPRQEGDSGAASTNLDRSRCASRRQVVIGHGQRVSQMGCVANARPGMLIVQCPDMVGVLLTGIIEHANVGP